MEILNRLVQALYSGVLNGSVYGLMAIGLTLIWGSLRMLNLAHGALYIAGAYIAYGVLGGLGLPVPVTFALAVGGAALVGLFIQLILINPILEKPGRDHPLCKHCANMGRAFPQALVRIGLRARVKMLLVLFVQVRILAG